jgi:hypothetical protein
LLSTGQREDPEFSLIDSYPVTSFCLRLQTVADFYKCFKASKICYYVEFLEAIFGQKPRNEAQKQGKES